MGRWLEQNRYIPGIILCSTATRTRETLDRVLGGAGWAGSSLDIRYEKQLYHAAADTIVALGREALGENTSVLIVGHNPGMEDTLVQMAGNAAPWRNGKLMTTACLAILESDDKSDYGWQLVEFRRPGDLGR